MAKKIDQGEKIVTCPRPQSWQSKDSKKKKISFLKALIYNAKPRGLRGWVVQWNIHNVLQVKLQPSHSCEKERVVILVGGGRKPTVTHYHNLDLSEHWVMSPHHLTGRAGQHTCLSFTGVCLVPYLLWALGRDTGDGKIAMIYKYRNTSLQPLFSASQQQNLTLGDSPLQTSVVMFLNRQDTLRIASGPAGCRQSRVRI